MAHALKSGSKRLLATYLQTLLAYPGRLHAGRDGLRPQERRRHRPVPPLSEERLYPKEKALIDMVAAERMEGRRVLVYATHTGTRDITERMDDMLTRHGFRVAVNEGRRGGPGTAGGVGGGQGETGNRRDDLPPQAGADRPRPHRLPDPLLVRDRLLRLHHAAGITALLEDRTDAPRQGHLHGLSEHPPIRRPQAGSEETPIVSGGGRRAAGGRPGRLRGRRGTT